MSVEPATNTCFGCGLDNPIGLHLDPGKFDVDGGEVAIRPSIAAHFNGIPGVVHGGISTTLLDEAMSAVCRRVFEVRAVTGEMNVRFRKPVPIDTPVEIRARGERDGRKIRCSGEIRGADDDVLVEATGLWIVLSELR